MKIDQWLESNTFHHSEFWDVRQLVADKEKQNLKISLCIPTLNEEKTIGKEIVIFRSHPGASFVRELRNMAALRGCHIVCGYGEIGRRTRFRF